MKKLISMLMALALVMSGVCASAAQDELTILSDNKTLTLNEQFNEKTGLTVTIASSDAENINSANPPVFMYLYSTDAKGLFNQDIALPTSWESGRYKAYIDAPGDARVLEFFYVNPESSATIDVLDALNDCESADDMLGVISDGDNALLIGLDSSDELYEKYLEDALDFCYESKDGDYTFATFGETFTKGIAVAKILEEIKDTEVYGDLEDLIKENSDIFGIDFDGDYDDVKQKSKVFVEMFKNKSDITDFASVAEVFDDAVDAVLKAQKKSESSSSGGGSSSGSSRGGSTIVIPSTDPVAPIVPVIPQPEVKSYSDIEGHFAKDAVETLSAKNVISGYPDGTFLPDNGVTRAEFAKIAASAFSYETKVTSVYSDVSATDWFAGYVGALSDAGVITGYDGKFNPNDTITRQDAACIIYRILKDKIAAAEAEAFADIAEISDYALDAVNALRGAKIVNGSDNMFNPKANITRGEAAVMINNALNSINK